MSDVTRETYIHHAYSADLTEDDYYCNPITAFPFLTALYGAIPDGVIEFTCIAPDALGIRPKTRILWYELGTEGADDVMQKLRTFNQRGYGVYFGVGIRARALPPERRTNKKTGEVFTMQPRGGKQHVRWLPGLWAEVDHPDKDAMIGMMWAIPVPPSIIVHSGGGWHGYWLFHEPLLVTDENRHAVDRALYALAHATGADTHSAELARVLRLPDSVNTKPSRNGATCRVTARYGSRYHFDDLFKMLRPHMPAEAPRIQRAIPLEATSPLPRWVQEFLASGAPSGSRNATLFKVACAYNDAGLPQYQCEQEAGAAVIADDFTHDEAMRTIASAYRRPAQPRVAGTMGLRMGAGDRIKELRGKR